MDGLIMINTYLSQPNTRGYGASKILLKPYVEGVRNLKMAFQSLQKYEKALQEIGFDPSNAKISLCGRVNHFLVGVFLVSPIINMIVLLAIRALGNQKSQIPPVQLPKKPVEGNDIFFPYFQKNPNYQPLAELAESRQQGPIKNTGLTDILQYFVFGKEESYKANKKKIDTLLQHLATTASNGSHHALTALQRPNNPNNTEFKNPAAGMPRNSPLCLLVKMGNLEGAQHILPVLQADDLLFTTPRGNSALHLAVATGQIELVFAIMHRAEKLNILEDLLAIKNVAEKIADDFLKALLTDTSKRFHAAVDVLNPLFGGEEINKALVNANNPLLFIVRNKITNDLPTNRTKKIAGKNLLDLRDMKLGNSG